MMLPNSGFADEPFHVQAHRGASAEAMENTLPAFERAFRMGATSIELDVHLTRDGHLVIYHDFHLDPGCCRLKDGTPFPKKQMVIRDMTLDQIREVILEPASSKRLVKHRPFLKKEEYRIPTLAEVYDLAEKIGPVNGKETLIDVEVKSLEAHPEWSPPPDVFAKAVAKEIEAKGGKRRSLVRSFDFRILEEMRKVDPGMKLAMLTEKGDDFLTPAARLRPAIVAPNVDDLNREVVEKIHRMGMQVIPWTVNGRENWARMQEIGVDGVTTDDPLGLIRFLNSQKRENQLRPRAVNPCLDGFGRLGR